MQTRSGGPVPDPEPPRPGYRQQPYQDPPATDTRDDEVREPPTYLVAKPATPRRTYGPAVLVGSSLTALAVGLAGGYAAFHKADAKTATAPTGAAPSATATAATVTTVGGHLTLADGWRNLDDTNCDANPARGFTDISAGAAVTIGDQAGQTLAVTQLEAGKLVNSIDGRVCQFGFSVQVPGGKTLYTVTVSHRGTQTFTPGQALSGIDIILG